jgi:predicted nucleic acid-binding protein
MPSPALLVDTNVLSELSRRTPNAGVVAWAGTVSTVALSAVTLEEIFYGLAWRPNPRIQSWLEGFLASHCVVRPVTAEIARIAGQLRGSLAARGEPRTQADMLIAATAQVEGLTLVTRNERDFAGCGVPILNPFS